MFLIIKQVVYNHVIKGDTESDLVYNKYIRDKEFRNDSDPTSSKRFCYYCSSSR